MIFRSKTQLGPVFAALLGAACVSEFQKVEASSHSNPDAAAGVEVADSGPAPAVDGGAPPQAAPAPTEADADVGGPEADHYYFCINGQLEVSEKNGLLANDGSRWDLDFAPDETKNGAELSVADDGSFTYDSGDSEGAEDSFVYVARNANGRRVETKVTLSGLPLFPNDHTRMAGFGEKSYTFDGVNGLISQQSCAAKGLATVSKSSATTSRGQAVQLQADGSFVYEPQESFWGTDEFEVEFQLAPGRTVRFRVQLILSPKDLLIDDLKRVSGAVELAEQTGVPEIHATFGSLTGASVSGGGDINGDGFDDVVIGATGQGSLVYGAESLDPMDLATLRHGNPSGLALRNVDVFALAEWNSLAMYRAASGNADFNGDGQHDFAFGLPDTPVGHGMTEIVLSLEPRSSPPKPWMDLIGTRSAAGHGLAIVPLFGGLTERPIGETTVPVGDFNGDGLTDFLVSAGPTTDDGIAPVAYVVFGRPTNRDPLSGPPSGVNGLVIEFRRLGKGPFSSTSAGDVDGDGKDDLLLGRLGNSPQSVRLVKGTVSAPGEMSVDGLAAPEFLGSDDSDSKFGAGLAGAFDFNGDGWPDLAFGDPAGSLGAGRVYVVFGSAQGFEKTVHANQAGKQIPGTILRGKPGTAAGSSLAALGDVNGDGKDDLLVAAPGATARGIGRVYVVYGTDEKTVDLEDLHEDWQSGFVITGNANDELGTAIASAGDINGDGYADIIVGAPKHGAFGSAFIVLGGNFTDSVDSAGRRKKTASTEDAEEVFIGSPGSNTLTANSGSDVLVGGAGDDHFHISGQFVGRVRGGRGFDVLHWNVVDGNLDLTALPPLQVSGIEEIDLSAHGDNTVTLDFNVLRRISSGLKHPGFSATKNPIEKRNFTLRVSGDKGDKVVFVGASCEWPTSGLVSLELAGVTCEARPASGGPSAQPRLEASRQP